MSISTLTRCSSTPSVETLVKPAGSTRRTRPASEFAELAASVRALGLLERRLPAYAGRAGALFGAVGVSAAAFVLIGDSWWQLTVAVFGGIVLSQFGFLAHDAARLITGQVLYVDGGYHIID